MNGVQEPQKLEPIQKVSRPISTHRKNYMKEYLREWHKRNPDKDKIYGEHRKLKIDPIAENKRKREWAKAHPEYCLEYARKYRELNKEKIKILGQKWCEQNKERKRETTRKSLAKYRQTEKGKIYRRALNKAMYSTTSGKLNLRMACGLNQSLKRGAKNGRKWEVLVGYTVEQLRQHLEKQFTKEMSWDNYGSYWWIDHIIPIKAFNFETPDDYDFKRCWSLKNLRPLEKIANIKKRDKVEKPFQPALLI